MPLASMWLMAQDPMPRYGHKAAPDKGPRALGIVQLSSKGKARIIPITIMMDGKFYDAGSYKASPVPMALDFGIVYEGFRAGVSQGIFSITQPGQLSHTWIAEGTWIPAGERAPEKNKKYSTPVIADDDKDGPPVLHRRVEKPESDSGADSKNKDKDKANDKDKDQNKDQDKGQNKDQAKPATAAASPPPAPPAASAPAPTTANPSTSPEAAKVPTQTASQPAPKGSDSDETIQDPNRPRLRRGKPDPSEHHEPFTTFDALPSAAAKGVADPTAGAASTSSSSSSQSQSQPQFTFIPAISDASGPEPRPYVYDLKPAEEAIYRNKMLDLAAAQLAAQSVAPAKNSAAGNKKTGAAKSGAKAAKPLFDDLSLRIFDLSSSNEPVLVLSAKTHWSGADSSAEPKEITLIARTNLEGELRKLFFSQTDSAHLDVAPRMELIDAVDADGDGRGELLFRRTFDDGSAYAIYRVTADRLWPLFEGTP
jgi:hypothetical protein